MIRSLAGAVAAALLPLMVVAGPTSGAQAASLFTYTAKGGQVGYEKNAKRFAHPLAKEIRIVRVWAGRTATTARMRIKVEDLLTARQVRRRAPHSEMHFTFSLSKTASDGVGRLGFTAAEVIVDREKVRVEKTPMTAREGCDVTVRVRPRKDLIVVAAPFACGLLEGDPATESIYYDIWTSTDFRDGERPARTGTAAATTSFWLDPAGQFAGK